MRRLGTVVALVAGVTLVASATAQGKPPAQNWGTIRLKNVGDEPEASGQATLTCDRYELGYYEYAEPWENTRLRYSLESFRGELAVTCQNLKPREKYRTPVGTFKTQPSGSGKVNGEVRFYIEAEYDWWGNPTYLTWFAVKVVRSDETVMLTGDYFGSAN